MIDIVSEKLLEEYDIEKTLLELNIDKLYVCRAIEKREELSGFTLPIFEKVCLNKSYLLKSPALLSSVKEKGVLTLIAGGSLNANAAALTSKADASLFNPIGSELCFDEGLAELARQNKKTIYFNVNEIRVNQHKAIRQMQFIIPLLKSKGIEMRFVTFAKKVNELLDQTILECFLENFWLEKATSARFLEGGCIK